MMGKPEPIYLHTIEDLFNFIEKANKEYEEKKGRKIMIKEKTHEIKESRIKELAGICTEYKNAMHILFPEAFESERAHITTECRADYFMLQMRQ